MPDIHLSSKRPSSVSMKAASARVLRTSRLLLLPAVALTLTACSENPISAAADQVRQEVAGVRESARDMFRPEDQLAQNDVRGRDDDERDGRDDGDRDGAWGDRHDDRNDRDDDDDRRDGWGDRDRRDDDEDRRGRRADRDDERYRDRDGDDGDGGRDGDGDRDRDDDERGGDRGDDDER